MTSQYGALWCLRRNNMLYGTAFFLSTFLRFFITNKDIHTQQIQVNTDRYCQGNKQTNQTKINI